MNKQELIRTLAHDGGVTQADAGRVLAALGETLVRTIAEEGGSLTLPGVGVFKAGERTARTGRNPATGESISIPASRTVTFKPDSGFRAALKAAKV
jgi:DNA-binding protein HU-beta